MNRGLIACVFCFVDMLERVQAMGEIAEEY